MRYALIALILIVAFSLGAGLTPNVDAPDSPAEEPEVRMNVQVLDLSKEQALVKDVETDSLYYLTRTERFGIELERGQMLQVIWNGIVMESYPAQFGNIFDVRVIGSVEPTVETIVRDLLIHVVEEKPDAFSDIEWLSVDLSESGLSPMQEEASMFILGNAPFAIDLRTLRFSREELIEMGTIVEDEPWNGRIVKIAQVEEGTYAVTLLTDESDTSLELQLVLVWADGGYQISLAP